MSIRILTGDCREMLKALPDASVQCCVTSPPYWGLRRYLPDGHADRALEIGSEPTPEAYVQTLVDVFREVWRVLRPDGVVWLNLGDAYHNLRTHAGGRVPTNTFHVGGSRDGTEDFARARRSTKIDGIKDGDLIGLPWMVAFALRADGWWLRQDNIWSKANPMPESVRNRTTRAHEYIFQLAKSGAPLFWTHRDGRPGSRELPTPDYRWQDRDNGDAETSVEPSDWQAEQSAVDPKKKRWRRVNLWEGHNYFYDATAIEEEGEIAAGTRGAKGSVERAKHANGRPPEYKVYTGRRNKRSVWQIATQAFPEAHFATYPAELAETCVKAGTSERGCCCVCGAPWVRNVERQLIAGPAACRAGVIDGRDAAADSNDQGSNRQKDGHRPGMQRADVTLGWFPTCSCDSGDPVQCVVLDPFAGAGTTCLVADRLGRDAIGIELNRDYAEMAERRIVRDAGLFAEVGR